MAARKLSEGSTGSEGRVVGPDIESNGATHSMSIAVCLGSLGSYWASVFQEKALGPNRLWSPRNEMFEKHEEAQICAHCQDPPTTSNPLAHLEATRRYCKIALQDRLQRLRGILVHTACVQHKVGGCWDMNRSSRSTSCSS